MFIYILKLNDNKYYIGKSKNKHTLYNRINQHYTYRGCTWTKKYKPINIIEVIKYTKEDKFIEDKIVFDYMNKYGIDNVRGGSFCSVKLKEEEINIIKKIIQTEEDRCFYCNSNKHLMNECKKYIEYKNKENKNKENIIYEEIIDDQINEEINQEINKKSCCKKIIEYFFNIFSLIR